MIEIYTDGSSKLIGNGIHTRVGAWAVFSPASCGINLAGGEFDATNQRMELVALLKGCLLAERLHTELNEDICIYSDSKYALNCVLEWSRNWELADWHRPQNKEIINLDIIRYIYYNYTKFAPEYLHFEWVKGHSNTIGNNVVDKLAQGYAEKMKKEALLDISLEFDNSIKKE
jgi:ribonuclease HI